MVEDSKENSITDNQAINLIDNLDKLSDEELNRLIDDDYVSQDMDIILSSRHAMIKNSTSIPDTSRAWQQFKNIHVNHLGNNKIGISTKTLVLSVFATAAVLLIAFLLWHPASFDKSNSIIAFSANNSPLEVRIGTGNDLKSIHRQSISDGIIINDKLADFSRQKDLAVSTKTITTPRGKDYKVILADGTIVQLNADSKIIFPSRFVGKSRVIKLIGEAYFKVSKNAKRPFIVKTEKLTTRVLGTEFNLKAYPASSNDVTLITGSVIVANNASKHSVKLQPGQNVKLADDGNFNVTTVDTEYFIEWKEGFFYFDNVPLIDVVRELGRWYNVNVEICDNSLASYRLHFIADRNASIDSIVENLNSFNYLHVIRKNKKIIISKKD